MRIIIFFLFAISLVCSFIACDSMKDSIISSEEVAVESSFQSIAKATTRDFAEVYANDGNKGLKDLTLLLAEKLENDALLDELTKKIAGNPRFYLNDFIQKNGDVQSLESNLGEITSDFAKVLPDFPVHVELYLHPKYRDRKLDEKLLIACVPVVDDSLMDKIVAFDRIKQAYEVDAWVLPDDRVTVVLRIDEFPKELYDEQMKLQKTATDTTHSYLYMGGLEWYTTNKGEAESLWPPEYYTKSWYCYNSSCTSTNGRQVYYFSFTYNDPENDWIPVMESENDMNYHEFDVGHMCWGGTNTLPRYDFKVELWERDLNEPTDDDFLDRYVLDLHTSPQTRSGQYNVDADFTVTWYTN